MGRFFLAAALWLLSWPAFAVITVDNENAGFTSANTVCTSGTGLTTANSNELVVVILGANETNAQGGIPSVSSVTFNGTSLAKRSAYGYHSGNAGTPFSGVEVWAGVIASPFTGVTPVITYAATFDNCAHIDLAISGHNTSTPWDTATSSGYTNSGTNSAGTPAVTGMSTNCDNTILLEAAFYANSSAGVPDQTTGTFGAAGATTVYNQIAQAGADFSKLSVQYLVVAATQSGITDTFGTSWLGNIASADALQAAGATCAGAPTTACRKTLLGVGC